MKLNRILSLIVLVVAAIIGFHTNSNAQSTYYPGYVVQLNGDTLKGEIKKNPKREGDNFTKAAYRKKDGVDMKTFGPAKIKSYCVDGTIFVSRNVDGDQVFVKQISKGVVCLYEVQVEVMQMNEIKVRSDFYIEKHGGEFVKIKSSKFKKQMTDAMSDNQEIVKGLEDKTYDYENIVEVVNTYNRAAGN